MWKSSLLLILSFSNIARAQSPESLVQDAISKQKAGDLDGAVREYRQFLKSRPDAAVVRANLGAALAGLGQFEEAITEYRAALRQSPSLPGLSLNLGLAYYKMGRIGDHELLGIDKIRHEQQVEEEKCHNNDVNAALGDRNRLCHKTHRSFALITSVIKICE